MEDEQTTNGPKKKDKRANNDLQTKDRVTRTPLITGSELWCISYLSKKMTIPVYRTFYSQAITDTMAVPQ
jgi:hypothetical protein